MKKLLKYKNAVKTQRMIKDVYLQILSANPNEKIKVKDLLVKCNVSKATFYSYFADVGELRSSIEEDTMLWIKEILYETPPHVMVENFKPFLIKLFINVKKADAFNRIVFTNISFIHFIIKLRDMFIEYMMQDSILLEKAKSPLIAKRFLSFMSTGVIDLLKDWIESDYAYDYETMADMINEIAKNSRHILFP